MAASQENIPSTVLLILFITVLLTLITYGVIKSHEVPVKSDEISSDDTQTAKRKGRVYDGMINTWNKTNETLNYHAYFPERDSNDERLPLLIFVGGLGADGKHYRDNHFWRKFCDEQRFSMIAPSFKYDSGDWKNKQSYQYPSAWSGKALMQIIREVEKVESVDANRLFLFGFSAGAQFVHRYALLYPDKVRAVAAHAAGGYTLAHRYISTRFLITVGQNDQDRLKRALRFVDSANAASINVRFHMVPNLAHRISQDQVEMSGEFFTENY